MDEPASADFPDRAASEHRLSRLLAPSSIALVGASARDGTVGNMMVRTILASGFPGAIHLINPRYSDIDGVPCLPSLADLPAPIDLVVVGVGAKRVAGVLEAAIVMGAGSAVVFDACHGEHDGGRPLVKYLRDMAAAADFPVMGGSGMGFFNMPANCHVSFYTAQHLTPGGITLIAHSGSVSTVLALNDPRYRFDLIVSPGQEIGATIADYIDYAVERPTTRVVALFMEAARDPAAFSQALAKAAARGIPVVACKVGRTAETARLAHSHTGALAGSDTAYDAVFEHYGAVRVDTVDQLMNTAMLLAQGRPIGPGGAGLVTDSGGLRETLIDRADQRAFALADLSPATSSRLATVLPAPLTPSNPVDAAGPIDEGFGVPFGKCIEVMAEAPEVAMLGLEYDGRDDFVYHPGLTGLAMKMPEVTSKPCFVYTSFANANNRNLADRFADAGIPLINGQDEMISAVAGALRWRDMRARTATPDESPQVDDTVVEHWKRRLVLGQPIGEAEGLSLLREFGIAATGCHRAETLAAALSGAQGLGYPVALKTAAEGIHHKSDVGGVKVGLEDGEAVQAAYEEMSGRLGPDVIVQAMAPAGVELAFGCVVDPDFGPLVMVSAGGTLIESLSDRAFALAPFGPAQARRMVDRLICRRLLDGVRGAPPANVDAVCHALSMFSVLCATLAGELREVDVNPIVAGAEGVVAVDCLVIGGDSGSQPDRR